jgi:hypothetical protein
MPDVVQETTYMGHPMIKVYYATFNGEDKFVNMSVKAAAAVADNIDRIYQFVDKHTKPRGQR